MHNEARRAMSYQVDRLHREGVSIRQIAKRLGISRKTVRRLLKELELRRTGGEHVVRREAPPPAVPRGSQLDAFDDQLREWITRWQNITAVRCWEKLKELGFMGGYTIVRERVKRLRRELVPPPPPAVPFEAAPGQRAEFDWAEYVIKSGEKVRLFGATLRFSRAGVLQATLRADQSTTLQFLQDAFEAWGGVPRECLTDSMPGIVDRWERDEPILNVRYVDFAAHYGFTALTAPRACPEWKAVQERIFGYHEVNLLNGRDFHSLAEYADALAWWSEDRLLARLHTDLGQPISEVLALERPQLNPLPAIRYDARDIGVRVVDGYGRVQWATNHYPAGTRVGDRVYVCVSLTRVEICDPCARRLAEHDRLPDGAGIKLTVPRAARRVRYDIDELCARVAEWGDVAAEFAARVRSRRRTPGPELVKLLQLQIEWSPDDLVAAMRHAIDYRCNAVSDVERILDARFSRRHVADQIGQAGRDQVDALRSRYPVTARSLADYSSLRDGDPPSTEELR